MNLNCSYQFPNPAEPTITVGDVFIARCKADSLSAGLPIDFTKMRIKFEEGKKYELVALNIAPNAEGAEFYLTSYVVGPKKLNAITLTDGFQDIFVQSELNFEVKSILKPDQKPEMFGPMSGLSVVIPFFYWALLAAVLVVFCSAVGEFIRRRWKRRKLHQRIEALNDGTRPVQQFFATYRQLQRENLIFSARSDATELEPNSSEISQSPDELLKLIVSVETALKLFITRTFKIDGQQLNWRSTLKDFDKHHEVVSSVHGADLVELSREFQKIGMGKNKLQAKDAILISEKTRKWVEKADQMHQAILSKDTQLIKKIRGVK